MGRKEHIGICCNVSAGKVLSWPVDGWRVEAALKFGSLVKCYLRGFIEHLVNVHWDEASNTLRECVDKKSSV